MPRLNEARCGCRDALPAARIDQLAAGDSIKAAELIRSAERTYCFKHENSTDPSAAGICKRHGGGQEGEDRRARGGGQEGRRANPSGVIRAACGRLRAVSAAVA
ncbi:hypothetical protein EYF80_019790 [Liparis tanakae]|uniref:Uncharacterized protein n=1 Tax=Liparis tanakae TaxID=230148 RepID=A0A4Z2HW46_9TELE|nr:hypothetical protein EYF80_019790 [Liparis tanakae]